MSKIFRKWIQTSWDQPGALRGLDIPYSNTYSLTARIDQIKDSTDQSIRVEEVTNTPPSQNNVGKIYTKTGDLYFLDESGNEVRISSEGRIASIDNTKIRQYVEYKVLSGTDVSNKYIDLQKSPNPVSATSFSKLGGNTFVYGTEYSVVAATDQSNPLRLSWDATCGLVLNDVVRITYYRPEEQQEHATDRQSEFFTLSGTDITNKYIDLTNVAVPRESTELVLDAGSQHFQYSVDFVVKQDANGEYKRLSWAAADTSTGLESVLLSGDSINVKYTKADNTQMRGVDKRQQFITLTPDNIVNKYVDISYTPVINNSTELTILGGAECQYTTDFIIKRDANGNYRRLSWSATDCTVGLEGVVISGDILKVTLLDNVGLIGAVRVSASDTAPTFLSNKIIAGTNISIGITGTGSEQTLTISSSSATDKEVEYLTLSSTDISNKYKDLSYTPVNANEAEMTILGGLDQGYGTDYTVITNGSALRRLTWDSGASGGPSVGLVGSLVDGDKIKVSYIRTL